uniref:Uncharacterized protein n=1 Tax=Kalanchoe fedtschenkoi TaxID=63787 RepID=A0A7N0ZXU4_KALFE
MTVSSTLIFGMVTHMRLRLLRQEKPPTSCNCLSTPETSFKFVNPAQEKRAEGTLKSYTDVFFSPLPRETSDPWTDIHHLLPLPKFRNAWNSCTSQATVKK